MNDIRYRNEENDIMIYYIIWKALGGFKSGTVKNSPWKLKLK